MALLAQKNGFRKKQSLANELMSSYSAHEEPFLSFVPWICKERGIPEPQSSEERQILFETLVDMNSVRALGPIVKLMRWFSWFQCENIIQESVGETNLSCFLVQRSAHHHMAASM